MILKIREDANDYMQALKAWLSETENDAPEKMSEFFSDRLSEYEKHMSIWARAYERFARLLPEKCAEVLDLGCGTGLELDEIFKIRPDICVTGIDLCEDMLDKTKKKHPDKNLRLICGDYFAYDMSEDRWEAILSFESLHHFLPEKKLCLYKKIYRGLKKGGVFLLGDYMACCEEEEALLRTVYLQKRRRFSVPDEELVHLDIPLTLEHEEDLLRRAGFSAIDLTGCIDGAVLIRAEK